LSHRSGRQPKTYVKPEAAITDFELFMMGGVSPETCRAIKKHWNNKFYYTFASFLNHSMSFIHNRAGNVSLVEDLNHHGTPRFD
jgi:hypothetical protein